MHDIVTVGSVTQDTYISSPEVIIITNSRRGKQSEVMFQFGTKIEIDSLRMEVGGGATNAAATFANFGLRTAVLAERGDDPSGEFVLAELRKAGIDTQYIVKERNERTAYSILFLGPKGERTAFVFRGASRSLQGSLRHLRKLQTKWVYLTSVAGDKKTLASIFALKGKGVNIAWNPGKSELRKSKSFLKPFLARTDILFVNKEESKMLFGPEASKSSIRKAFSGACVVTDGKLGSKAYIGNATLTARIRPVAPKDTTGAGDAFGSGFLSGILNKPGDFPYALTVGSANAMSVVQEIGAKHGLIRPHDVKKVSRRIRIHSS